jgi:hypothetical protein
MKSNFGHDDRLKTKTASMIKKTSFSESKALPALS